MHFLCVLYLLFSMLASSYYLYALCTLIFFPPAWSVRLPLWRLSWPSVLKGVVAVLSSKVDWSYYICVKALFWCCVELVSLSTGVLKSVVCHHEFGSGGYLLRPILYWVERAEMTDWLLVAIIAEIVDWCCSKPYILCGVHPNFLWRCVEATAWRAF